MHFSFCLSLQYSMAQNCQTVFLQNVNILFIMGGGLNVFFPSIALQYYLSGWLSIFTPWFIEFAVWPPFHSSFNPPINLESWVCSFQMRKVWPRGLGSCGVMGSIQGSLTLRLECERTTPSLVCLRNLICKMGRYHHPPFMSWEFNREHLAQCLRHNHNKY